MYECKYASYIYNALLHVFEGANFRPLTTPVSDLQNANTSTMRTLIIVEGEIMVVDGKYHKI